MVSPVGSDTDVPVDVRVIAATHRNLEEMVAQGKFRADLYFRLAVVPITLPSLRERPEDILPLAEISIARSCERLGRPVERLDASARDALLAYHWPGNVRELAHLIERTVLLTRKSVISEVDLPLPRAKSSSSPGMARGTSPMIARGTAPVELVTPEEIEADSSLDLRSALENLERSMIERALSKAGGNRTEAAALLGLNRTTLVEKLRKYAA